MKRFLSKYASTALVAFASVAVITSASLFLIHNPKVPDELLKK